MLNEELVVPHTSFNIQHSAFSTPCWVPYGAQDWSGDSGGTAGRRLGQRGGGSIVARAFYSSPGAGTRGPERGASPDGPADPDRHRRLRTRAATVSDQRVRGQRALAGGPPVAARLRAFRR